MGYAGAADLDDLRRTRLTRITGAAFASPRHHRSARRMSVQERIGKALAEGNGASPMPCCGGVMASPTIDGHTLDLQITYASLVQRPARRRLDVRRRRSDGFDTMVEIVKAPVAEVSVHDRMIGPSGQHPLRLYHPPRTSGRSTRSSGSTRAAV